MSEFVTNSGRLVLLTDHARERLQERCVGADDRTAQLEVVAAVDEGRLACRKPRPLVGYGQRRTRALTRTARYAWSPDFQRVYLLEPGRRFDGHHLLKVVTVLTPNDWADA